MKRTFKPKIAFAMLVIISSLLLGLSSSAQVRKTVTGVVRDASGAPVSGVSIRVQGTKTGGAITDDAGVFSIKTVPGATIVLSSVGFETKEINVGENNTVAVQLVKNTKELSEVVVTGFGVKQETRKLSYAVTEIKGSDIVAANNSNFGDAMQGKVAGVTITQGTGGPSSSSRIQIRGNASLLPNTEPLVVLDGILLVPGTTGADSWGGGQDFGNIIKDLNPDDFESITVLKGSAASALYGAGGQNGVLLITTKKGHARKGLGVTFNHTESFDKAYRMADLQNEFGGGLSPTFAKDASGNDVVDVSATPYYNPNGGYSYGPKFDGHIVKDVDGRMVPWVANNPLKDFFQTGRYSNNNIVAEGGNEKSTYRFSWSNLFNTSTVPNNSFNRNSFVLRATHQLSSVIALDASINYTSSKTLNPIIQGGGGTSNPVGGFTYFMPRNAPISYYRHNFIDPVNGGIKSGVTNDPYYIAGLLWPMLEDNISRNEYNLLANLDLTAKIRPWLTMLIRSNVNGYNDVTENKQNGIGAGFVGGYYELDQSNYKNTRVQGLLTAVRDLTNDLSLTATIGGETQRYLGGPSSKQNTNGGLTTPSLYFIGNSVSSPSASESFTPSSRLDAMYAYGDLTWKKMLTANFSIRNDYSSTLTYADGHGVFNYWYPSVGLSWVFTELPALQHSVMSYGQLRASLGYTGIGASPYTTNSTGLYGQTGTFYNASGSNQTIYSFNGSTLGNQNLKNQLSREYEIGANVKFFNNRLGFDIAAYKKNSFNQLLSLSADQESGVSGREINAGNIQNQGIELLLTGTPVRTKDFTWNGSINFTSNRNKIVALAPGVTSYNLQLAFGADVSANAYVGKQYGEVNTGYGFASYDGNNKSGLGQRVIGAAPNGTTGGFLTFMRSQDYNGSTKDLGTIMPTFLWGTVQDFTYKSFIFSFQIDSKVGGLMASSTDQYGSETGVMKNSLPGRNAALGGLTYTDAGGVSHDDGIIPKGVLNDGIIVSGKDLGGMTYAAAVAQGYLKPIPAYAYYENLTQWSSGIREVSIFDNSWVAMRQVSIGYNLPTSIIKKIHVNGLRVSLTGRNLFYIWKDAKDGVNPEGLYNNQAGAFAEGGGLPLTRSMGATVNATF